MNNALTEYKEYSYIFFSVGTFNYAFNARYVLAITQLTELEYPESMPDYIAGLFEYNNSIIKIIDLRHILKIEPENYSINSKIIILKAKNETFGVIIDEIKDIRRINSISFNPPPYDREKSYLEAIYTDGSYSATIVNIENIEAKINSKENEDIKSNKSASLFLPSDLNSKEILHRRKLHYLKKAKQGTYEIIKSKDAYITFLLDKDTCCVKITHIAGFYKLINMKITKIPCTPDFIVGVVSIKGRYITVIDLLKYTENKNTNITKDTNIIVLEYEDYEIGILADSIGETIDIDETILNQKQENSSCLTEHVINDSMHLFLDIKKFFGEEKLYIS